MPDDSLYFDTDRAIVAAQDLAAAGQEMLQAFTGDIGHAIMGWNNSPPWGKDAIGASFDEGYMTQQQDFWQALFQIANFVEGMGKTAEDTTRKNVHADEQASATMRQISRNL